MGNTQKRQEVQRQHLGRALDALSPGVEFHDAEPTDVSKRQGCFYLLAEFGSVFLYGQVFLEGEARREKILDEDS